MINLREFTYKVGALSNVIIPLGVQGETGATTIRIDFSEWLEDGTEGYPSIFVITPNGSRYPAATNREDETDENGSHAVVVWPITDIDTAEFGDGLIRVLLYSEDEVLMKSAEARTCTAPSFLKGDEGAPRQYEYWLEILAERVANASLSSINAVNAAREALQAAANSQNFLEAIRAMYTLIQAGYNPPGYIMGVMAASYPQEVSIEESEWELVDNEYVVTRTIPLVKTTSVLVFLPDKTAGNMEDTIFCGPSAEETAMFKTEKKPTGTVSGVLLVLGHMNSAVGEGAATVPETLSYLGIGG